MRQRARHAMLSDKDRELERWIRIALWLADCHAANLSEAELSSCSKTRRKRFKNIMLRAARMLKSDEMPPLDTDIDGRIWDVIYRLEGCASEIKD